MHTIQHYRLPEVMQLNGTLSYIVTNSKGQNPHFQTESSDKFPRTYKRYSRWIENINFISTNWWAIGAKLNYWSNNNHEKINWKSFFHFVSSCLMFVLLHRKIGYQKVCEFEHVVYTCFVLMLEITSTSIKCNDNKPFVLTIKPITHLPGW